MHHFFPSANENSSIDFTFDNQPSTSAKYLEITIDNKLSFKQRSIFLKNGAIRQLKLLQKLSTISHFILQLSYALAHS